VALHVAKKFQKKKLLIYFKPLPVLLDKIIVTKLFIPWSSAMKVNYVSTCIDTYIDQMNNTFIVLCTILGVLFAILPPPLPVIALCVFLAVCGPKAYRNFIFYRNEFNNLSDDEQGRIRSTCSRHHHMRILFLMPLKAIIAGIIAHALASTLFEYL
jgi:hypothetical protein